MKPRVNAQLAGVLAASLLAGAGLAALGADTPRPWRRLADDRIHDPGSPAITLLQEPAEALSQLPPGRAGNHVDWVKALRDGYIAPRTNIFPETKVTLLDLDILMEETGELPMVLFPHRPHTEWLDCSNCHEALFRSKKGETPVNMYQILQGEYCGRCHGAVSFPLTECRRCHSVPRPQAGR